MKLGVLTDCFKTTVKDGIKRAGALGLQGVQIYATSGEFSPYISESEKKEFKQLLAENNLYVSALCGDMGGFGFEIENDNPERIEKTKKIIDLAVEFGASVVTTHIGVIPDDVGSDKYRVMLSALTECGLYAKSKGVTLAIETGPEKAATLLTFVKDTKGGVGVNLDPANFVMVTGQDPVEAVYLLKDYIVHTHVKDGIRIDLNQKAEDVYRAFALGGIDALNVCEGFKETPIGQGNVDWKNYIAALKQIGYDGYLTIERECGSTPDKDISLAVDYINNIL